MDNITGVIRGIWASDTNNIFFLDIANLDLIKYDGNQYIRYHYSSPTSIDFAGWCINGVSNSEVYIGGDDNRTNEPTFGKPQIKKWNGVTFETINIPDTFGYYSYISALYTQVPSVVWIGTNKGRVLKYQNALIEETYIDTSQHISRFMRDETGNLYFLAIRDSCNSSITWCRVFVSIFRFDNSIWQKVFYGVYEDPQVPIIPQSLGNKIYACDYTAFYKFTGYDYQKTIDIYGFRAGTSIWLGTGDTNIICSGKKTSTPQACRSLLHWNGRTWSDENDNIEPCGEEIVFSVQGKHVCAATDAVSGISNIYYGTKK